MATQQEAQRIIFIVGLPGSGKSRLGVDLAAQSGVPFFDDLGVAAEFSDFLRALAGGHGAVVADVNLCGEQARAAAARYVWEVSPLAEIQWIFFENDPAACRENVARRDDGRNVEGTIRRFSVVYKVPPSARALPVWRGSAN